MSASQRRSPSPFSPAISINMAARLIDLPG
jgi:hypothetical protein